MERTRIVAIIPVFNRPRVVIEALASVAAQTHQADRIVVVDDGSSDGTVERIEQWRTTQPTDLPFTLIQQANVGVAAARNRGVAQANDCELLAFLDSDDLWPTDYLQRMTEALDRHPNAPAAVAAKRSIDLLNGRETLRRYDQPGRLGTKQLFVIGPPGTSNLVIRRRFFERAGRYDETRKCAEDYQLTLRLSLLGPLTSVTGKPVIYRRGTAGVVSGERQQLSRQYHDRRYRLAQVLEQFIHDDGGAAMIRQGAWRKRLGRMWYSAGRGLRQLKRDDEAADCFRRCVRYWPLHARARWRLLWCGRK